MPSASGSERFYGQLVTLIKKSAPRLGDVVSRPAKNRISTQRLRGARAGKLFSSRLIKKRRVSLANGFCLPSSKSYKTSVRGLNGNWEVPRRPSLPFFGNAILRFECEGRRVVCEFVFVKSGLPSCGGRARWAWATHCRAGRQRAHSITTGNSPFSSRQELCDSGEPLKKAAGAAWQHISLSD